MRVRKEKEEVAVVEVRMATGRRKEENLLELGMLSGERDGAVPGGVPGQPPAAVWP